MEVSLIHVAIFKSCSDVHAWVFVFHRLFRCLFKIVFAFLPIFTIYCWVVTIVWNHVDVCLMGSVSLPG